MIQKSATVTESTETRVHVVDSGCRGGLNIGHLRAFMEQVDAAGLTDKVKVYLTDKLQAASPYHNVEIMASSRSSRTSDIGREPTPQAPPDV